MITEGKARGIAARWICASNPAHRELNTPIVEAAIARFSTR